MCPSSLRRLVLKVLILENSMPRLRKNGLVVRRATYLARLTTLHGLPMPVVDVQPHDNNGALQQLGCVGLRRRTLTASVLIGPPGSMFHRVLQDIGSQPYTQR